MLRLPWLVILFVSVTVAAESPSPMYFGSEGQAFLHRFITAYPDGPSSQVAAMLVRSATNDYPPMFRFAGEPSLDTKPENGVTTFRYAQAGTWLNTSCLVARFHIGEKSVRVAVAEFQVNSAHAGGFQHLMRGERLLSAEEQSRLRQLLVKFDVSRLPTAPGVICKDILPWLFEYRDQERHVVIPRFPDEANNVFEGLSFFSQKVVKATTLLLQIGSTNGSEPIRAETNSTASAVGSRR